MDISQYLKWQSEPGTRRGITIRADVMRTGTIPPEVWCYDYDIKDGKYVPLGSPPPTAEELKAGKKADLQRQIERMGCLIAAGMFCLGAWGMGVL